PRPRSCARRRQPRSIPYGARRRAAPRLPGSSPSFPLQNLGFFAQQTDELRHCIHALTDDAARRTIRRPAHRRQLQPALTELRRLLLERLLLSRHDSLERRITRLVLALRDREHGRER